MQTRPQHMMLIPAILMIWTLCALSACQQSPYSAVQDDSPLSHSRQLIVVITADWQATSGTLQRYEWNVSTSSWRPIGSSVTVSMGVHGLAWGRGLHDSSPLNGPAKQEGDGKSPAGVFPISEVFGYVAKPVFIHMPYRHLTNYNFDCAIHDVHSQYYNQIVRAGQTTRDWTYFEPMHRSDGLYEWGAVIDQNSQPTVPGAGSCIFLHAWRTPNSPSNGSTVMNKSHLLEILTWLDSVANPVIVQLPIAEYRSQPALWDFPPPI